MLTTWFLVHKLTNCKIKKQEGVLSKFSIRTHSQPAEYTTFFQALFFLCRTGRFPIVMLLPEWANRPRNRAKSANPKNGKYIVNSRSDARLDNVSSASIATLNQAKFRWDNRHVFHHTAAYIFICFRDQKCTVISTNIENVSHRHFCTLNLKRRLLFFWQQNKLTIPSVVQKLHLRCQTNISEPVNHAIMKAKFSAYTHHFSKSWG